MIRWELGELATLMVGIIALFLGGRLRRGVPFLRRIDMPNAVIGATMVALVVLLLHVTVKADVVFASKTRDALLLVFFTTIGLSAKLSALRSGGRPLLILCAVTILVLVAQNAIGILVATTMGAHPAYGLLAGSLSFVGGPGTALAWSKEMAAAGLVNAPVVAVGAATLAVISGALVAGPATGWIISRHNLRPAPDAQPLLATAAAEAPPQPPAEQTAMLERLLMTVLVIAGAVYLGDKINELSKETGFLLPGFLSAMMAGVVITNLADIFRVRLDFAPIEKGGELSLHLFLVIALMGTPLISVGAIVLPLLANGVIQIAVTLAIAYFVLFRLLGRDYDAAVTVGGFLGFGLSSMPVAMATMDEVSRRYGPSPKAFLLITLAGSFFVDLANAVVAKAFFALPMMSAAPAVVR